MSSGLVPIFSWKTRKNSTNGSMGNKKFAKKNFCHTPTAYSKKGNHVDLFGELKKDQTFLEILGPNLGI